MVDPLSQSPWTETLRNIESEYDNQYHFEPFYDPRRMAFFIVVCKIGNSNAIDKFDFYPVEDSAFTLAEKARRAVERIRKNENH